MSMKSLMKSLAIASVLLLGLSGCYERIKLPVKHTPAASRVYVQFQVEQTLQQAITNQIQEAMKGVTGTPAYTDVGNKMTAMMRSELVQHKVALPVLDPNQPVDLSLTGTFRASPTGGIDLEWQLVETKTGALVQAGLYNDLVFTGNVEPFADDVLAKLLKIDVDQYASGGPSVAPRPAPAVGLPPAPGSGTDGGKAYAVIVGIENYRENLPAATHAEKDAAAFAEYAKTTLGVPEAHIRVLTGQRAGRADLASMIEEWLPRNAREPGGKVYFFFSGHGAPDPETGDAYLVPYDADPAYIKTRGLSVKSLYASLESLPKQQAYVFLDACFSGSGDRSVIAAGTRPLVPVKTPESAGGVISLTASAARETTGAARDAAHGLFTRHLLAGLAGAADANADGDITLTELAGHVREKVSSDARLDNREQTPSLLVAKGINPDMLRMVQGLKK